MANNKKSKEYLYNGGKGKTKFEERLQLMVRGWMHKFKDPLYHTQKLLARYAAGYFDRRLARETPLNLTDRGVSTIVPFLVEGNPRIMVETIVADYRSSAYRTQLALNFLINKMNLAENVFIPAATMSMFGGVATRTYSEYDGLISLNDEVVEVGTPKIILIEPTDYIGDCSAKSRDDFIIEGNVYRLPVTYAKDIFSNYADLIEPNCQLARQFSAKEISDKNFDWRKLNLREYAVFIDVYVRDEKVIKTIMPYGKKPVCLRTIPYDGPGDGPYDYLGYKYFPGCPIPIPPAWNWHDLDVTMNAIAIKAREQAEAQKNIIVAEPASKKAAEKILKASNMDVIVTKDAKGINTIAVGGVNPDNYNWMQFAEGEFTKTGVNPDVLGGRGAQAPTLGQEQLVYYNASRIINSMNTRFTNFMTSVVNKLAYYTWTDPTVYIPVIDKIPGVGDEQVIFSQADKVGDFYDFVFDIDQYSTQRTSPEMKYQRLMQLMTSWILPTMQLSAMQGAQLDVPTATRILSDYAGVTNLNQFYKTAVPQELDSVGYTMQPNGKKGSKSPGQGDDRFGSLIGSREANSQQQQNRTANNPMEGLL